MTSAVYNGIIGSQWHYQFTWHHRLTMTLSVHNGIIGSQWHQWFTMTSSVHNDIIILSYHWNLHDVTGFVAALHALACFKALLLLRWIFCLDMTMASVGRPYFTPWGIWDSEKIRAPNSVWDLLLLYVTETSLCKPRACTKPWNMKNCAWEAASSAGFCLVPAAKFQPSRTFRRTEPLLTTGILLYMQLKLKKQTSVQGVCMHSSGHVVDHAIRRQSIQANMRTTNMQINL